MMFKKIEEFETIPISNCCRVTRMWEVGKKLVSNKQSALKTSPRPTSERGAGLIKPFNGKLPQKYKTKLLGSFIDLQP